MSQAGGHFRHFWHLGHLGHLVALGFFVRGPSLGPGLLRWAGSRSCVTTVIERPVIWAGPEGFCQAVQQPAIKEKHVVQLSNPCAGPEHPNQWRSRQGQPGEEC